MRAAIVANGELEANARLREIWERAELRIAADGGARNARLFLERAPHVVVGDMDSLDEETSAWLETNRVELIQHPRAKDETDLELALLLAQERGAEEMTILGAFGGRVSVSDSEKDAGRELSESGDASSASPLSFLLGKVL